MYSDCFHIFLDTSEFYALKYDFTGENSNSALKILKDICQEGKAIFYINHIIINEVVSDLKKEASIQRKVLKDALTSSPKSSFFRFLNLEDAEIKKRLSKVDTEEVYIKEFETYLKDIKYKMININAVDTNDMFRRYFHEQAPFANKQNKKSEFPDAYAIYSILEYLKENDIEMIVVSRDNDWRKILKTNPKITYKESLNDALGYINENLFIAEECIFENRERVNDLLIRAIEDSDFYLSDEEGEVDSIKEIMPRDIYDIDVLSVMDGSVLASGLVRTEMTLDLSVFDHDNSYYDPEDKKWFVINDRKLTLNVDEIVYFEALITINDNPKDVEIEILNVNQNMPFTVQVYENIY